MLIGLIIAIFSSFGAAFTENIEAFLFMRLLQGIGSGVCTGIGRIIIADIAHGKKLAVLGSYVSLFQSISPVLAPVIGSYIQKKLYWQANFIVLGGYFTLILFIYLFLCQETNLFKNPYATKIKNIFKQYKELLLNPTFIGSTILSGCVMGSFISFSTLSSFILQIRFHVSPVNYGLIIGLLGVLSMFYKAIFSSILNAIGSKKTIQLGIACLFISGFWILIIETLGIMTIPLLITGVAINFFGGPLIVFNALSYALSPFQKKMGAAGALYSSIQILIGFIASTTVASLSFHSGALILGISYLALAITCIVSYIYFISDFSPTKN